MSRRMFEFVCANSHRTEALVHFSTQEHTCPVCGEVGKRVISAPTMKLEGFTGSFPSAYDSWERKRAEKLVQERKQNS
jgi:ribosomal protein L37AE/L43A